MHRLGTRLLRYSPDADALIIKLLDSKPIAAVEAGDGVILHYDEEGRLVEIEILDASELAEEVLRGAVEWARRKPGGSVVRVQA